MLAWLRYLDTFVKFTGGVALCRAPALRRLAGRTQLIISAASRMSSVTALPAQERTDTPMRKSKRLAIVGATGMVGGYAL
jgi:hypothetical protein